MKCVILCAGKGSRFGNIPKVLVPINGKPLLWYVIDMWKPSVDSFVFVVGYRREDVIKMLPSNSVYVIQEEQKGIADAILKVEDIVDGEFIVALGDCIQKGTWDIPTKPIDLGIGVWETDDKDIISRNYSVEIRDGYISQVIEKPKKITNRYCGMGTYFLDKRVFNYIRKTPKSPLRGEIEITDTIQLMINSGEKVTPVIFKGKYLNVTYPEDIKIAEEIFNE